MQQRYTAAEDVVEVTATLERAIAALRAINESQDPVRAAKLASLEMNLRSISMASYDPGPLCN